MIGVVARAAGLSGSPDALARFARIRLDGRVAGVWLRAANPAEKAAVSERIALLEPPAAPLEAPVIAALVSGDARRLGDWARGLADLSGAWVVADHPAAAAWLASLGGRAAERASAALAGLLLALPGTPAIPLGLVAGHMTESDWVDADRWAAAEDGGPSSQARLGGAVGQVLRARAAHPGFAAAGIGQIPDAGPGVFVIVRDAPGGDGTPLSVQHGRVVCIANLASDEHLVSLDWRALLGTRNAIRDLVTGVRFNVHGPSLGLAPWQIVWATV